MIRRLLPTRLDAYLARAILALPRIHARVEQLRAAGVQRVQILPAAVRQAEPSQRVVSVEQRHARIRLEQRRALMSRLFPQAEQLEHGRGGVDDARRTLHTNLTGDLSWRGDDIWHAHVLVVNEQGVREIPRVFAKCFTVIAEHDEERVRVQTPLTETSKEPPEGLVSFMQRIEISGKVAAAFERPVARRRIGMMAGDREVGQEEAILRFQ